ncbi:hypothetical protein PIB30_009906 [Stylosanthes scabra]|uniref:Secreted protein n=1 Tax=Stylosanthes scabra TaxID=79078 RepID=A0ABU6S4T1_9FABA|nr:hypothetical protein [Stylosanthes scabra]
MANFLKHRTLECLLHLLPSIPPLPLSSTESSPLPCFRCLASSALAHFLFLRHLQSFGSAVTSPLLSSPPPFSLLTSPLLASLELPSAPLCCLCRHKFL